jgi:transcriptional regulator with XRE-family HTH domain
VTFLTLGGVDVTGSQIRDIRRRAGVTQDQLALASGFSQMYFSLVERDRARLNRNRKREILSAIRLAATLPRAPRRVHGRDVARSKF